MFLTKPTSELTYEDTEALTSLGEPRTSYWTTRRQFQGPNVTRLKLLV